MTDELFEGPDAITPEAPARAIGVGEKISDHEVGKERLGDVLGSSRRFPVAAQVTVNRQPIGAAELFEGFLPLLQNATRIAHDAPVGRGESAGDGSSWSRLGTGLGHGDDRAGCPLRDNAKA